MGIFTDGTLNNAGNIEIYRQQVEETCLVPHSNGEIDDAECERRLALLLGVVTPMRSAMSPSCGIYIPRSKMRRKQ